MRLRPRPTSVSSARISTNAEPHGWADPKKSVVDANCKVHDAPNIFVTDGAVFTTQGCYEPTLTIMAISARAGEHIARAFRRG